MPFEREGLSEHRILKDTTPVQRGVFRNVILLLDMSNSLLETDYKPSRLLLMLNTASIFITEFFSENPISELAIIITRDGLSQRLTNLSGSPAEHLEALEKLRPKPNPQGKSGYTAEIEVKGRPSLQNSLELARAMLSAAPTHLTREIIILYGSLSTVDPGDIHQTIHGLVADHIRVCVVGMAARIYICSELVAKTHNFSSPYSPQASAGTVYGVALDESHYNSLVMAHITPPPVTESDRTFHKPALIPMGFASEIQSEEPGLCSCHHMPSRGGYKCPRCLVKLCRLPMKCPVCGLQCILSTHLARAYHHLYPLKNWVELDWANAHASSSTVCFGCRTPFPEPPNDGVEDEGDGGVGSRKNVQPGKRAANVSESGRYACPDCREHYCITCDIYAHEVIHNCPGCLQRPLTSKDKGDGEDVNMSNA